MSAHSYVSFSVDFSFVSSSKLEFYSNENTIFTHVTVVFHVNTDNAE